MKMSKLGTALASATVSAALVLAATPAANAATQGSSSLGPLFSLLNFGGFGSPGFNSPQLPKPMPFPKTPKPKEPEPLDTNPNTTHTPKDNRDFAKQLNITSKISPSVSLEKAQTFKVEISISGNGTNNITAVFVGVTEGLKTTKVTQKLDNGTTHAVDAVNTGKTITLPSFNQQQQLVFELDFEGINIPGQKNFSPTVSYKNGNSTTSIPFSKKRFEVKG